MSYLSTFDANLMNFYIFELKKKSALPYLIANANLLCTPFELQWNGIDVESAIFAPKEYFGF